MKAWIPEIRRMAEFVEGELSGVPIDRHEARRLACRLARQFPHIQGSLTQILTRLGHQQQPSNP